jgi:hypothetical protein
MALPSADALPDVSTALPDAQPLDANGLAVFMGVSIVAGLVSCFYGYRFFKLMICITGALVGAGLCGALGYHLDGQIAATIGAIIGAIIGGVLLLVLYFISVFLLGMALAGGAAYAAMMSQGSEPNIPLILIAAIIGGAVALAIQKFIMILFTAFAGAASAVAGIYHFVGSEEPFYTATDPEKFKALLGEQYLLAGAMIALGLIGAIVQFTYTGRKKSGGPKRDADDAA